ncbi:unnamed protein product (macronuclear) [Paramecium tetraurelia]|uniref:Uncharacterized protein n=1 Tax=Paramecium tetraurelia TaxID=5888 RepID=A0DX27_PARTE|nr:uncharacterized protein GSPATT00021226001 [Paramecium tetraurelia]CAK87594.1 unnamed protein product [Paramecium tetraurelia]|eukprot:XP_001454991.1 hypothetical protein (macronuclear) [Paramecium tetraurelia strain d4-2]
MQGKRDDRFYAFRVYCTSQDRGNANQMHMTEWQIKNRDVWNMYDQSRIEIYISGNGGIQ